MDIEQSHLLWCLSIRIVNQGMMHQNLHIAYINLILRQNHFWSPSYDQNQYKYYQEVGLSIYFELKILGWL
ncbi:MAG: hypothetical protein ACJAXS_002729 [Colwellia sp.]|jgi:hypothetical protein